MRVLKFFAVAKSNLQIQILNFDFEKNRITVALNEMLTQFN